MKIVFGIMSAVHSAYSVDQLANALAPWPVVVHHDFVQKPDFKLTAPNAHLVSDPKRTGWAVWEFSEGILHLLKTCLDEYDADYFQLLSPTCLPVKPVNEFASFIAQDNFDIHVGAADLLLNDDLEMTFGYRAYAKKDSLKFRILRKLRSIYFADNDVRIQIANMQARSIDGATPNLRQRLARCITRAARRGWLGNHPFSDGQMRPMVGGTWFGCRRQAGEYLLSSLENPVRCEQFKAMAIPDEMMFSSVFWNSPFEVGLPNHFVNTFDEHNPRWIDPARLDSIQPIHFFARKFRDDPADPARCQVLSSIGYVPSNGNVQSKPLTPVTKANVPVN